MVGTYDARVLSSQLENARLQIFRRLGCKRLRHCRTAGKLCNKRQWRFHDPKSTREVTLTRRILGLPIISETKLGVVSFDIATKLRTPFGRPAFDVGFLAK